MLGLVRNTALYNRPYLNYIFLEYNQCLLNGRLQEENLVKMDTALAFKTDTTLRRTHAALRRSPLRWTPV